MSSVPLYLTHTRKKYKTEKLKPVNTICGPRQHSQYST